MMRPLQKFKPSSGSRLVRRAALGFFTSLVLVAWPAVASASHVWQVPEWDVEYVILEDGRVRVKQRIVFDQEELRFGVDNNKFLFSVLLPFHNGYGPEGIEYFRVYDAAGQVLPDDAFEIYQGYDRAMLELSLDEQVEKTERVIEYFLTGAVASADRLDSLSVTVIPDDLRVEVAEMSLTVRFPEAIPAAQISAEVLRGRQDQPVVIAPPAGEAHELQFEIKNVAVSDGVWANLSWPTGFVALPERSVSGKIWRLLTVPFYALPVVVGLFLAYHFVRYGRDPRVTDKSRVHRRPPEGLSPAHLGALIHERVRITFLIAMVVDLAQRGYLQIIEEERRSSFSKKDYTFVKQRDFFADKQLTSVERYFLESLFTVGSLQGSGRRTERVKVSTLKNHFAVRIHRMREMVMDDLVSRRYFREHPQGVRQRYVIIGSCIAFFALPVWLFGGVLYHSVWVGLPIVLTAGMFFIFAPFMPQKTKKGALAHEWAEHFKRYLHHADRYGGGQLSTDMFSRYLPYAMIFGVERSWSNAFEKRLKKPPSWFVPSGSFTSFSAASFAHSLRSSFTHAASQNLLTAPGRGSHLGKNTE